MKSMIASLSLILLAAAVSACGGASSSSLATPSSSSPNQNSTTPIVQNGSWYGSNIRMTVTDSGASIQLGCASGTLSSALSLDTNYTFQVSGTYIVALPSNPPEQNLATTYSGTVNDAGDSMTLTITETSTGAAMGNYQLQFGSAPPLMLCE